MRLRIGLIGMSLLLFIAVLRAQKSADDLFQQATGLEAKGDNPGAIKIYERIVKEFASNRSLAATATIHLARLSDVQGQDKALSYYQTILDKYSDQTAMAVEARKWIATHANTQIEIKTPYSKDPWSFAISPNGKSLVFLVTNGATSSLWLRRLDTNKQGPIPGTESSSYAGGVTGANPFWSPDGRFVAYFEDRKLKTISVDGGTPKTLANAPSNGGGTWNAAGDIVFTPDIAGTLFRVSAKGAEEPVQLTFLDSETSAYRYPGFFPDGRYFLMYPKPPIGGGQTSGFVTIGSLDGGKPKILQLSVGAAAVVPPNHLVFAAGNALHTRQLNPRTMELDGSSVVLAEAVAVFNGGSGRAAFSVSDAGPIAYRKSIAARRRLLWRDALGTETSFENQAPTTYMTGTPRFSSNGQDLLFARNDYFPYIFRMNSKTGALQSVDVGVGLWSGESPIWSPDRTCFVFAVLDRSGSFRYQVFKQETSPGTSPRTRFLTSGESDIPTDWRGEFLLFNQVSVGGPATNRELMVKLVSDGSVPMRIAERAANGRFSPEGKWLVYESDEPGGSKEIFVQPFPGTAKDRLRVSNSGGTMAQWSWDGTSIYFLSQDNHIMAAGFKASSNGKDPVIEKPASLFSVPAGTTYAPAPDGRFLMFEPTEEMPPIIVQTNLFGAKP